MEVLFFSIIFSMIFQLSGKYFNLYKTILKRKNIQKNCNENLKISIIIPTYNEESVIEKSINTIQKSTYKNFEIIVIDDNSTDKTFEILKKLEKKYDNLKILKKQNERGKAQSLNEAIVYTKGDIILFLDADTLIEENFLEEHIKYFYNAKINMIYVDFEAYNYKEKLIYDYQEIYFEFSRNILYSNIFSKVVFMGNGVFIRKKTLEKVLPLDNTTLVDDVHLAIKLNQEKINQIFIIYPKTKIQYTTNFKDLFFQHKRWYLGGIEELIKAMKYKDFDIIFINLIIFTILIFPIISFIIMLIDLKIGIDFFKYYISIVWGLNMGSAILIGLKNGKFLKLLINIFITTPIMLIFEYSILVTAFFNLNKKEKKWYKVKREKI